VTEPGSPRAVRAARLEAEVNRLKELMRRLALVQIILACVLLWHLFR